MVNTTEKGEMNHCVCVCVRKKQTEKIENGWNCMLSDN